MADDQDQLLPEEDIQALLAQAQQAVDDTGSETPAGATDAARPESAVASAGDRRIEGATPMTLGEFDDGAGPASPGSKIDLLKEVRLNVKIELGRTAMYVEDVLGLAEGSVVTLDRLAGDPVDILVNDRLVAKGEVLVLNDNFCVRIAEILPTNE